MRAVVLWAIAMLGGCGVVPAPQPKPETAPSGGTQPAAAAAEPSASRPAPRVEPTLASKVPPMAPRREARPLTQNGDLSCPNLVAPFALTENLEILKGLGMDGLLQSAKQIFDSVTQGASADLATKSVSQGAKHSIPYILRAAAYQMNWIPMPLEVAYGKHLIKQLDAAGQIEPRDSESAPKLYAAANQLLQDTLGGVVEPHDYNFQVVVTTRGGQNAEALPGGFVLIDPSLIEDPKLARKARFALAHEVGHVLQRHQTRAMQARIIDAVSLRGKAVDLVKVMGESKKSVEAVIALTLAGKLQFERFYAGQELHSDGCAVRILNRTQPSATELISVLQDFIARLPKPDDSGKPEPSGKAAGTTNEAVIAAQRSVKDTDALIDLVSRPIERHPTNAERVKNLNLTLAKLREEAKPKKEPPKQAPTTPRPPQSTPKPSPKPVPKPAPKAPGS